MKQIAKKIKNAKTKGEVNDISFDPFGRDILQYKKKNVFITILTKFFSAAFSFFFLIVLFAFRKSFLSSLFTKR